MQKSRIGLFLVVGIIVLLLGVYILRQIFGRAAAPPTSMTESSPSMTETPPSMTETPPPPPPSINISAANTKPIEVKAQTWVDIYFTLPARACTLTGHVEGISGGQKDFEGFVMDDDNYRTWSSSNLARGDASQTWGATSGRLVVWSPNVTLQGPGIYHLVVSNLFSATTSKVVTVQASVNCR
jgi:hypothetical protein